MILKFYLNNEHSTDYIQIQHSVLHFLLLIIFFDLVLTKEALENFECGKTNLSTFEGTITSPFYPFSTSNNTICEWKIFSPKESVITLRIVDLDLQQDLPCLKFPCCSSQWLLLPKEGENDESEFLCGNIKNSKVITVSKPVLSIKYYSFPTNIRNKKRGFKIVYEISRRHCSTLELKCGDDKCISKSYMCDGVNDCEDGSDERNCSTSIYSTKYEFFPKKILEDSSHIYESCIGDQRPCEYSPGHCYSSTDLCDRKFDCPKGEDEVGCNPECPNQIACSSGGCYYPNQRCNYKRNCRDNSDETGCPPEPCLALQFRCLNGACVPGSAICDGTNNCGDYSDEENCTKSSFLTAALMGLLSCLFLFCIGLSCLYKVYSTRLRASISFAHQLEPDPMEEEFSYREPPPAYSVAVGENDIFSSYSTPEYMERYLESDSHHVQSRNYHRSLEYLGSCVEAEPILNDTSPLPRPSTGITIRNNSNVIPECSEEAKLCKVSSNLNTSNFERVMELIGFERSGTIPSFMDGGGYHNRSPNVSQSHSPTNGSVTSSTSLEDASDVADFCHF